MRGSNYLSLKETAVELGLSLETVKRYARAGRLEGAAIQGRSWRVPIPVKVTKLTSGRPNSQVGENYYLPDNGCRFSTTCLNCILPKCIYDMSKPERIALQVASKRR